MQDFVKLALGQIPGYFMDVAGGLLRPRAHLSALDRAEPQALPRALTYNGISLLIMLLLTSLLEDSSPTAAQYLLRGILAGTFFLVSVLSLHVAWKLVGGRATLRDVVIYACHMAGPALVGGALLILPGAALVRLAPVVAGTETPMRVVEGLQFFVQLLAGHAWAIFYVGVVLMTAGSLVLAAWVYVCWGALREVNGVGSRRSLAAALLYGVFTVLVMILAGLANILTFGVPQA